MDIPLRAETITVEPQHYAERPPDERRAYQIAVADVPLRLAIQKTVLETVGEPISDTDLAEIMRDAVWGVFETDAAREQSVRTIDEWLAEDEPRRAAILRGESTADVPSTPGLAKRFDRLCGVLSGYDEVLRKALAQKVAHGRVQHMLTLSFCLRGWAGPALPPFRLVNGRVPMDLLSDAFERTDTAAAIDANLLWMEAWRHMIVTPQEKKASDSP